MIAQKAGETADTRTAESDEDTPYVSGSDDLIETGDGTAIDNMQLSEIEALVAYAEKFSCSGNLSIIFVLYWYASSILN